MDMDKEQYQLFCGLVATLYLWRASETMGDEVALDGARRARDKYIARAEAFDATSAAMRSGNDKKAA